MKDVADDRQKKKTETGNILMSAAHRSFTLKRFAGYI